MNHIGTIGERAIREAYAQLLRPATIEAVIRHAYSQQALERRWEDHPILIAVLDGRPRAFADAIVEQDRVVVAALYTEPASRRLGAGTQLIGRIRQLAERLPTTVDVILGNTEAEQFIERCGFVPGESLETTMFGEPVVERRWYLGSLVEADAEPAINR